MSSFLFLACLLAATYANAQTATLQQGSNSYVGCTDSYIHNSGYQTYNNTNFGANASLKVECERYVDY